jgi:hypothetical protein
VKSEFSCSAVLCNLPVALTREELICKMEEFGFQNDKDVAVAELRFLKSRHADTFDVLVWFPTLSSMHSFASALHGKSLRRSDDTPVLVKECAMHACAQKPKIVM